MFPSLIKQHSLFRHPFSHKAIKPSRDLTAATRFSQLKLNSRKTALSLAHLDPTTISTGELKANTITPAGTLPRENQTAQKRQWLRKMRHDSDTLLILASPRGASSLGQHVALERPEVVNLTALTWRRLGSFYRFFTAPVRAPPGIDIGSYSGKGGFIGIVLG